MYFSKKKKSQKITKMMIVTVAAAASMLVATMNLVVTPNQPIPIIPSVYADDEIKQSAIYAPGGEGGGIVGTTQAQCDKKPIDNCKDFKEGFGANPNKAAREICESISGEECKKVK
jgi:hypothetical protein